MGDVSFIIMLLILIVTIAFLYRFYQRNNLLLQISQGYLGKIISNHNYVLLDMDQMLTLPEKYKIQAEYLISEIRGEPATLVDISSETPEAYYLMLFNEHKTIVALLKIFELKRYDWVYRYIAGIANELTKSGDDPIFISGVIVHPKYRGIGYGKKMFDILKKYIKKDMVLEVKKDNTAAIQLYRKSGFKLLAHNEDSYIMRHYIN